jgi:hypothetical protein
MLLSGNVLNCLWATAKLVIKMPKLDNETDYFSTHGWVAVSRSFFFATGLFVATLGAKKSMTVWVTKVCDSDSHA